MDPTTVHLTNLASQVGGHAGVQTTEDGSLIIKPALPLEHQFYQTLATNPGFSNLLPFVPKFYGTLKLEGEVQAGIENPAGATVVEATEDVNKDKYAGRYVDCRCLSLAQILSLVLENLSHTFLKPNILDIKLGTVLYDESASEDKVERMLKTAAATTSLETGVRLTGFQVYDNTTGQPVNTPKSYGKSIKPSDLPNGISKFFPVSSSTSTAGLPAVQLLPILIGLRDDIQQIREAFAEIEMRMVGGSLLIVYEGDLSKAKEGLEWLENYTGSDEDEEEDEDGSEDGKSKPSSPYLVKLIDFAHTRLKPGEGPDEGVLKGFDTVLSLLDGRIAEVEALVKSDS